MRKTTAEIPPVCLGTAGPVAFLPPADGYQGTTFGAAVLPITFAVAGA